MDRLQADTGAAYFAIESVNLAANEWSREQPGYSSRVGRIHAAVKKLETRYEKWSAQNLESKITQPAQATQQLSLA